MAETGIVYSPEFKRHVPGPMHPECPARLDAVMAALQAEALDLVELTPREAQVDELALVHEPPYIERVYADISAGRSSLSTGDTDVCAASYAVSLLAAGAGMTGVDAVVEGRVRNAFCAVRPPGHHAGPARGMGFCVFNNIALAARYAQRVHGIGRVLIADWDVHHGNGTQDVFYDDGSVLFFSTHQYPWYPGTGRRSEIGTGPGNGTILNCPCAVGSGRREIVGAFRDVLVPAAKQFKPELVLVSAGFDSSRGDPLGGFTLSDDDFVDLTTIMTTIAYEHADGRLVSFLEGGYDLGGLACATAAHVRALAGAAP